MCLSRKITQSLMFLPYFISWVIVGVMAFNILSSDYGFMNRLIESLGGTRISFYTTLQVWPLIMPTTVILFLMSIGGVFKGNFDMFYNLVGSNGLLYNYTDVIDTLTFRALISNSDYGMSAAIGLYQSVLCFITVMLANKLVGIYDRDYALF